MKSSARKFLKWYMNLNILETIAFAVISTTVISFTTIILIFTAVILNYAFQ